MIRIRCVVERITFQNPENGYTVLKVAVKGYDELVTVVGIIAIYSTENFLLFFQIYNIILLDKYIYFFLNGRGNLLSGRIK